VASNYPNLARSSNFLFWFATWNPVKSCSFWPIPACLSSEHARERSLENVKMELGLNGKAALIPKRTAAAAPRSHCDSI